MQRIGSIVCVVLGLCLTAQAAPAAEEWGDLTATFLYAGVAPKQAPAKVTTDLEVCGKFGVLDESLVVNPKNNGVAYVIAFLTLAKGDAKPPVHPSYLETSQAKVKLDNSHCRFDPHVLLLRTTQTLLLTNSDSVGHNCKVDTFNNPPINYTLPAGGELTHKFALEERLPTKVSCSIHPWMSAWVLIKDLPYMGVSDANGKLVIEHVPAGTWTFQFWHEKAGYLRQVEQNGKAVEWSKGRVELTIKPGTNSLGEIKLTPASFAE